MAQASAGRVVMSVDCTALLNQRHFDDPTAEGGRRSWMTQYPRDRNDSMSFDEVTRYVCGMDGADDETRPAPSQRVAVVTYGNGVVTALQAVAGMSAEEAEGVVVIDSPYLSAVPQKLREAMAEFDVVLFAEICKDGPGAPLLAHACALHNEGRLPRSWYVRLDQLILLFLFMVIFVCACVWTGFSGTGVPLPLRVHTIRSGRQ